MENVEAKPVVVTKRVPPANLKGEALKLWEEKEAILLKMKELNKKEVEANKAIRKSEMKAVWVVFRGMAKLIKAGSAETAKVLQAIEASMQAHEGYKEEDVKADKEALKVWIDNCKRK